MIAPGLPRLDPKKQAITLISSLTKSDFPDTGARDRDRWVDHTGAEFLVVAGS